MMNDRGERVSVFTRVVSTAVFFRFFQKRFSGFFFIFSTTATMPNSHGSSDEQPPCSTSSSSSSSSSSFTAPRSQQQRGHASPPAPTIGDLAGRLDGWSHPDDRMAVDGSRLAPTKYARPSWRPSNGDFRSARSPVRANVEVPFAMEPSALREFLWGEENRFFLNLI
jgi:hypothetical protein